jgi:glucose-1-phosphate adenylyltransferase
MNKTITMVLAGGKGKRMDLLCHVRPKPELAFAGRFKVIDFSLSNCIRSQIEDIYVLTDYQRHHIRNYLTQWHMKNAGSLNFRVLEPENGSYKGTADAVYQNMKYLENSEADTVLVLAGDHVYKCDYRRMVEFHHKTNADITIAVTRVPDKEASRFGTVTVDNQGKITKFLEKSSAPQSNLASMGIYVFKKQVLMDRLAADAREPASLHDFGYSILPEMVRRDSVYAYNFSGYWRDIGTVESYHQANLEFIGLHSGLSTGGRFPVLNERQNHSSLQIGKRATLQNSLISTGCIIRGRVENSVLSPGVVVEEKAVVRNSVVMKDTRIGYHSIVDHCVLDERINIGEYSYIGFGSGKHSGYDITVLGEGVTIPAYTAIGSNCRIHPYVDLTDFISDIILPGTVLVKNTADRLLPAEMMRVN